MFLYYVTESQMTFRVHDTVDLVATCILDFTSCAQVIIRNEFIS